MTTKDSPVEVLKATADMIASLLKAAERGEPIANVQFAEKIAEARGKRFIKVGIVMDDKVLTPEIPWETIADLSEPELSRWIVNLMRELGQEKP